ncbi:MAG: hypothetical protein BXU00_02815 [Candidatus Nanoclepta minutus]|uniref:Uncharacterized protein n=1 Tax=Candidatus Nanoclepta minutus TaxID=1940235 RepID=A0A397WQ65_9ARCH|nr:MAG: hypothetical protein BXU00_02815 [Candidatus Nanoclepta minutus]
MKIVFFVFTRLETYAGTENWVIKIGNELVDRKYNVWVISSNYGDLFRIKPKDLGKIIKFRYILSNKFSNGVFRVFRGLCDLMLLKDVDYIYLVNFTSYFLHPILSIYTKKANRIIIGNHTTFLDYNDRKWRYKIHIIKLMENKMLKYQHKIYIHILNSAQKEFYEKLGFKNVYLVPNFVNSKEYLYPKDNKEFILTFMGRIHEQKGFDVLIEAIKKVLDKNKEIKFYVAGSGDKKYEEMLRLLESKYPENVKYFGFVDENTKREILSKSSLFFIPSRFEGFPIAVVEALVSGSPFLGSNIVAFRDLLNIYDKNFGWIKNSYNPEAFANKILEIYTFWKEDPRGYFEKRKYVAKRARELFDIKKVVDKFEEIFLS